MKNGIIVMITVLVAAIGVVVAILTILKRKNRDLYYDDDIEYMDPDNLENIMDDIKYEDALSDEDLDDDIDDINELTRDLDALYDDKKKNKR